MNKQKMTIWGRELELEVIYDCFKGEEILESQKQALSEFIAQDGLIDSVYNDVVNYCLNNNNGLLETNKIENIFKYVVPQKIFVVRMKDDTHVVCLLCAYRFDIEHDLVIVFKDNKLNNIGPDIVIN